jgi:hypothetical protein
MEKLPKSLALQIGNVLVLILIPLSFISQLIDFSKTEHNVSNSAIYILGNIFAGSLFVYTFWLSFRTRKIYSGKVNKSDFPLIPKIHIYLAYIVMTVLFITWIFFNWQLGTMGFDWIEIILSLILAIYPFHILNIIYYLKENSLVDNNRQ